MAYTINPMLPRVRMEAVRLIKHKRWSTRKVARYTGYAQSTIVKWCKRDKTGGWREIPTLSSKPRHHPKELKETIINEIIKTRLEINRSSEIVHKVLKDREIDISLSSVKRTLDRHNMLRKRSPWKRYHHYTERPDVANVGDLIQVDTIHLLKENNQRIYVFTLIDIFSRWTYARAYEKANTKSSIDFLRRAQLESMFEFKNIQSDHGPEFSSHFTERIKINHRHSRIRKPNDNAHLERFNRTLQEECLDKLPKDINIINKSLKKYLRYYNEERYHFGLNLKTPMQMIPSY